MGKCPYKICLCNKIINIFLCCIFQLIYVF